MRPRHSRVPPLARGQTVTNGIDFIQTYDACPQPGTRRQGSRRDGGNCRLREPPRAHRNLYCSHQSRDRGNPPHCGDNNPVLIRDAGPDLCNPRRRCGADQAVALAARKRWPRVLPAGGGRSITGVPIPPRHGKPNDRLRASTEAGSSRARLSSSGARLSVRCRPQPATAGVIAGRHVALPAIYCARFDIAFAGAVLSRPTAGPCSPRHIS